MKGYTKKDMFMNKKYCYGSLTRFFHWISFFLVFLSLLFISLHEYVDSSALSKKMLSYHKIIGILILGLTLIRVVWKILGKDRIDHGLSKIDLFVSKSVHFIIYLGLFFLPLLGWMESSAREKEINIIGFVLPAIIGADDDLADFLQEKHVFFGFIFVGLITAHIAAAIFHGFILKNKVLYSMIQIKKIKFD